MNRQEIVQRYLNGETEQALALDSGVGCGLIKRLLLSEGIERRDRGSAMRMKYGEPQTKAQLRIEVLIHYGGRCFCCGQDDFRYLTFDHIEDNGAEHRRNNYSPIYVWLKARGYPEGIQILCANCNTAKAYFGGLRCTLPRKKV